MDTKSICCGDPPGLQPQQQQVEYVPELMKCFLTGFGFRFLTTTTAATTTTTTRRLTVEEPKNCRYWLDHFPWKTLMAVVTLMVLSIYGDPCRRRLHFYGDFEPEWEWDHNIYNPRQHYVAAGAVNRSYVNNYSPKTISGYNNNNNNVGGMQQAAGSRNMLVAQVTGSNIVLNSLGEICSRPNRAYARQWGRDYVRFAKPSQNLIRSCFDKIILLSSILEKQLPDSLHNENGNWILPMRVVYDAIALFPTDAIITDLDYDLLDLIPENKLIAIAGWSANSSIKDSSFADVLLINLRHKYSEAVIKLWHAMVKPPVTCGAGNDLSMLLQAVESVLAPDENMDSVLVSLKENRKGMIGNGAIKVIPLQVPGPKAGMLVATHMESKAILQTTADSVCYRYYPRCEVF